MRIGLINENSQADKNGLIYKVLNDVAKQYGHIVLNFGKYSKEEERKLPYTHIGIEASIILETHIVDFVVTGCGTGQGAAISCNAFPNVVCGIITSPMDAYLFAQINSGNAISIPYAERFGWGAEIELRQIFQTMFSNEFGKGYPIEYAGSQMNCRDQLENLIKSKISGDYLSMLKRISKDDIILACNYPEFVSYLNEYGDVSPTGNYIKTLIAN